MSFDSKLPLVWIDCEMTGLNTFTDNIIEICCLITDKDLNLIDEKGYESVIHVPKSKLDAMDQWCLDHHGESGLIDKVLASSATKEQVDSELKSYIAQFMSPRVGVLAGNSVHMDRNFMIRELPETVEHLHYRILDVSSISEFAKRHNPDLLAKCPPKQYSHTARADIEESIAQMRWLRDNYLIGPDGKE
ncbi:unnamed protein product [Kuraishia capsulata CBS 1993]|uniref:Exonuclease domain-containing protein n=1 Tax=Kuraishia capsulata CBS 1993 TaxID=1382522 RepID=W6MJS4_9ASCO|nr:uncharacterized protein KUCA_T00002209001 [Kuraishia capsulata CBS 1993]CDK26238.1 unnamed protein product [Kuraishia capsulata CBS 1993]